MRKPTVVVFFGGSATTSDLSAETGYWMCNYIPRESYRVVPVRVTPEGLWQVPLGALPQSGPITHMMEHLFQAIPALPVRAALERLLQHPVAALMTTVRGQGGDDGTLQALGELLNIPVIGSPRATCQETSDKHLCMQRLDDVAITPYHLYFPGNATDEEIVQSSERAFSFPVFTKPVMTEGSTSVALAETPEELAALLPAMRQYGNVMVQEKAPGTELNVTIVEDEHGQRTVLPPTAIHPLKGTFYDQLAKRRPGRVKLTTENPDALSQEAQVVALDAFDQLGCRAFASIDVTADQETGIHILEVNTVPTFTTITPLPQQLDAAHLHPTRMVDGLIRQALGRQE